MIEPATAVRRPSPRPRPADEPARPTPGHLRVVPDPNSEMPTSGNPEAPPTETITAGQDGSPTVSTADTSESGFRTWITRSRDYWTAPKLYTDRPASLADLAQYAKHAPWTAQQTGPARTFGVWYYRAVAYPYTAWGRTKEHFVQRPLRFATLLGVIKVASMTGPGGWIVDHLIYPAAHLAGHVFL